MGRERILLTTNVRGQLGQLEGRLIERASRSQVRLPAQQGAQPAVEAGRRCQEPLAQVLELLLLEQEVFADARVKGLDRLGRQRVPLFDPLIGLRQRGVGPRLVHQSPRDRPLGPSLHREYHRQPDHPGYQSHRRAGDRSPISLRPAARLP